VIGVVGIIVVGIRLVGTGGNGVVVFVVGSDEI
jgi:hypothetical protein